MAKNNKNILIGLGIIAVGGAAYYFIKNKGTTNSSNIPYTPATTPPATTTKASLLNSIKENKDFLKYRGKVILLSSMLKLGFQYAITNKVTDQLKNFYSLWKNTPKSMDLPYGNVVDQSNIDYYILDLSLHKSVLSQLTKM